MMYISWLTVVGESCALRKCRSTYLGQFDLKKLVGWVGQIVVRTQKYRPLR